MELLAEIAKPRPVGTVQNQEITGYIESYLEDLGYETIKVPFDCKVWEAGESFLTVDGRKLAIQVSPFSESFNGTAGTVAAGNIEELQRAECEGRILFLTEDLAKEPLQPKDYPFYYPDEHKSIIECLEAKSPCAVIAVTGETSMSGLKPFYLVEDGNFHIPVASLDKEVFAEKVEKALGKEMKLAIVSRNAPSTAYQLIASKKAVNPEGTIVICAHMDTKYNTDGALDNASGVAAMLYAAGNIENTRYNIDIVPFNSEEYYDPQGELIYLEKLSETGTEVTLVVNIDTVAHIGSKTAVASVNFSEKEEHELDKVISSCTGIVRGQPWYAGDHAIFAFGGTKCVIIYASDLFEECLSYTHCPKDTTELVDEGLIRKTAEFVCKLVNSYK